LKINEDENTIVPAKGQGKEYRHNQLEETGWGGTYPNSKEALCISINMN
jgi:hypothetical protein